MEQMKRKNRGEEKEKFVLSCIEMTSWERFMYLLFSYFFFFFFHSKTVKISFENPHSPLFDSVYA